ncbi:MULTISPECIES: hypothetical protein [unclassified Prochlorococcus]|uniref:hypothetical protein n=1 Tax=unclassified Prochlorococcus TaxID=2627481 RepID=UPI000533B153|nr:MULTISPECIES: hypothetical protein [unclassified Prochlorococcus]KGG16238.1 hypothetical protein EV07_1406 [Prochlorococcus sp. MIT 0603]KGG18027.1 hypothetical protein EV06_0153 [Prochlorococcus sp. MIT 0602]
MEKVRDWLWMFPSKKNPKRASSWWLNCKPEPVLIDCPEYNSEVINDLKELAGKSNPKILLTSRDGHNDVSKVNKSLGWSVVVQEQESYLLPGIKNLESFANELITLSGLKLLWTPGPSPGSCVVYAPSPWNVLFCGRLLIPVSRDRMKNLRAKNTFHWSMQQESLIKLRKWPPVKSCPSLVFGGIEGLFDTHLIMPWEAWDPNDE